MEEENVNYNISDNAELKQHVEVWESLLEEKKEVMNRIKEHRSLVKGEGYDTKIVAKVIRLRAMSKDARDEEQSMTEVYMAALGEE